jgi:lipoprotein-anchoring transpeptidase ErfK/SrfK
MRSGGRLACRKGRHLAARITFLAFRSFFTHPLVPGLLFGFLLTGTPAHSSAPLAPQHQNPLLADMLGVITVQVALVREGISPGAIDGIMGPQTEAALTAFQQKHGLRVTGLLDKSTRTNLMLVEPPLTTYTLTSNDLGRLLPVPASWLGKSLTPRLDYETALELAAEKSQSHHKLVEALNPSINWTNVTNGAVVTLPNTQFPAMSGKAAFVEILLSERLLRAFGAQSNLVAQFPCSIAQRVDKRPVGELHAAVLVENPNYTFDPAVFPESGEARELGRKLLLQPGPNNPVGTVWIGLERPGYGIHGTPFPEKVGRTESHGCFRLANWNAEYLLKMMAIGTPVIIRP